MANDRKIAGDILSTASSVVTKERADAHGSAENSFEMIAQQWAIYLNHAMLKRHGIESRLYITPFDVAQMMVQLKIARTVYGDPANVDNYVDQAGYSSLAGMLIAEEPVKAKMPSEMTTEELEKMLGMASTEPPEPYKVTPAALEELGEVERDHKMRPGDFIPGFLKAGPA